MRLRKLLPVLTLGVALAATACSGPATQTTAGQHHYRPTTQTATPEPPHLLRTSAEDIHSAVELFECKKGPLQGCTKPQMFQFAQSMDQLTWNDFYGKETTAKPPIAVLFVPEHVTGLNDTGCLQPTGENIPFNANIYAYCGAPWSQITYLGVDSMFWIYGYGYILPILEEAHEDGHRLQDLAGIFSDTKPGQQKGESDSHYADRLDAWSRSLELQADCASGVWLKYAKVHKLLPHFENAYDQWYTFLSRNIDNGPHGNEEKATHGDAATRRQWILHGFNSKIGLAGCNVDLHGKVIFPGHPLVTTGN